MNNINLDSTYAGDPWGRDSKVESHEPVVWSAPHHGFTPEERRLLSDAIRIDRLRLSSSMLFVSEGNSERKYDNRQHNSRAITEAVVWAIMAVLSLLVAGQGVATGGWFVTPSVLILPCLLMMILALRRIRR